MASSNIKKYPNIRKVTLTNKSTSNDGSMTLTEINSHDIQLLPSRLLDSNDILYLPILAGYSMAGYPLLIFVKNSDKSIVSSQMQLSGTISYLQY